MRRNNGNRPRQLGELYPERQEQASNPVNLPVNGNNSAPSMGGSGQPAMLPTISSEQSNWAMITFVVGTTAVKVQQSLLRKFLLIQNKSATGTIYIGFGWVPNFSNGLELPPNVGYEPFRYPTNDIWVVGTEANIQGLLIFGT